LATTDRRGGAALWDLANVRQAAGLAADDEYAIGVGFIHDRAFAITQGTLPEAAALTVRALDDGTPVARLNGAGPHQFAETAVLSADGTKVAAAVHHDLLVWSVSGGMQKNEPIAVFPGRAGLRIAFGADGNHIATASSNSEVSVIDLSTKKATELEGLGGIVTSVALNNQGDCVVAGNDGGDMRTWNARTGAPLVAFSSSNGALIRWLEFEPNGRRIVAASDDGTVRLWDAHSGDELEVLQDNMPSGRRDRTDGTIGGEIVRRTEFAVLFAGFTPDGRRVVTSSVDGRVRAHFVNIVDLTRYARCLLLADDPLRTGPCDGSEKLFPRSTTMARMQ
jgi:WD40 repeat protein